MNFRAKSLAFRCTLNVFTISSILAWMLSTPSRYARRYARAFRFGQICAKSRAAGSRATSPRGSACGTGLGIDSCAGSSASSCPNRAHMAAKAKAAREAVVLARAKAEATTRAAARVKAQAAMQARTMARPTPPVRPANGASGAAAAKMRAAAAKLSGAAEELRTAGAEAAAAAMDKVHARECTTRRRVTPESAHPRRRSPSPTLTLTDAHPH